VSELRAGPGRDQLLRQQLLRALQRGVPVPADPPGLPVRRAAAVMSGEPGMEEFDLTANAGYVYVRDGIVAQTRKVSDRVIADYDAKGRLLGYELFDAPTEVGGDRCT
jgi:uncharacterized protein YuzE